MPLATPTLILNTDALQTGDLAPFFTSLGSNATPPAWRRVSGSEGPLIVILATADSVTGNATRTTITGDLRLRGKIDPAATELTLLCEFTEEGDEGEEYYEAGTFNLAIDSDLWGDALSKTVLCDFEEVVGGEVIRSWRANLELVRGVGDGGSPAPLSYVGYFAQSATEEQKAQARENIGASSSSGDVVSDGTITSANSGKVAIVTDLKEIGAGVAYGVGTAGSIVIHDSTITMANVLRLAEVSGDSNGMIQAGPVYSQIATASSIVQRDSSGAIAGTNITANGHFKSQGDGAGGAGHLILAQGTTPNGTGSSTTLWGIANGLGWRNGNGTAYSLTLPTASGTLALVDGNLGTPTTLTLTNATGLPLTGLTGSFTPSVSTLLSPLCTVVITPGESAWSASTLSGSAALSAYSNGCRVVSMNASTAGLVRHVFASNSSHLPTVNSGSGPQVNWGKSWAANWSAVNRCPVASGTKQTIIFGAPTTQADHTLTSKSVRVTIEGNGTNVIASITAYQSGEVQSSTSTLTTDDRTSCAWRLLWNQGTAFTLYRNGTAICTLATGLPSGNGTALHHNIVLMHTQVSGGATTYESAITSICIDHLA